MDTAAAALAVGEATPRPSRSSTPSDIAVLCCAVAVGACTALLFGSTSASIITQWSTSETFAHGWFVVPMCAWLVWRRRDRLREDRSYRPDPRLLLMLIGAGLSWLAGHAAGVLVVEQMGLVALVVVTVTLVLGRGLARELRFALLMLCFLAPVGAELVPALMELTADLTVGAIRAVGIPIYREGLYFSIPSGNWSVVEACSGIRYLIASLMLGTLYSGLYLRGAVQRVAFVALSIVVPIAANAVRAFGIVMLGHFSGNRLATGADHLLYGWLFFGIVMFCLFAIGARFPHRSDGQVDPGSSALDGTTPVAASETRRREAGASRSRGALALVAVGSVLAASVFPAWAGVMNRNDDRLLSAATDAARLPAPFLPVETPRTVDGSGTEDPAQWVPRYSGYDAYRSGLTTAFDAPVTAHAYVYAEQRQGKELITSSDALLERGRSPWRRIATDIVDVKPSSDDDVSPRLQVTESELDGPAGDLLVWHWYAVRGTHTSDPVRGKLEELIARLTLDPRPSVGYVLSVDAAAPRARAALRDAAIAIARQTSPIPH